MSAWDNQIGGDHYKHMTIQPTEYCEANNLSFIEGCVIKYISRWRSKNGVDDLRKAKHYIELLIETEIKKPIDPSPLSGLFTDKLD
jgi:hypothetical protein